MAIERERILKMVAEGKISVSEAEELLDALNGRQAPKEKAQTEAAETIKPKMPKFMFVKVVSASRDNVDVRIPLGLLRAGMKFTSLIPPMAMDQINTSMKEKGINFDLNNLKQGDIEELIQNLTEMEVNVQSNNGDNVRVFCG